VSAVFAFILFYISFLAPYNLRGILIGENLLDVPEISQYFSGYSINDVKYLGSNTYKVITDKDDFIVITDYSDSVFWRYKIFKHDKNLEYFTNPM
jgi:hypothetical protein